MRNLFLDNKLKNAKLVIWLIIVIPNIFSINLIAQIDSNTNFHFQQTFINQYHPDFSAVYSGKNSLKVNEENCLSMTATMFFGLKLFQNANLYYNAEIAGGSGFSKVQGIAGFTNNEVVRVGDVAPTFYTARFFLEYIINLDGQTTLKEDDFNQVQTSINEQWLIFRVGKFSILDYFDDNKYSHDGRSQFMDWALVSNGAWDYSADTRGYTNGILTEYINPNFSLRFAISMVPNEANGRIELFNREFMKENVVLDNNALTLEIEKPLSIFGKDGKLKFIVYKNSSHGYKYQDAINTNTYSPDSLSLLRRNGTTKYGICLNFEQDINDNAGVFLRVGWNDGGSETWMFTEIDRSLSFGSVVKGKFWKREKDEAGLALCFNGLSETHKSFLKNGGYGFIIGDGNLNYGIESIIETYYKINITKNLNFSLGYQFISNPAYNKDRGPVNCYSIRSQIKI